MMSASGGCSFTVTRKKQIQVYTHHKGLCAGGSTLVVLQLQLQRTNEMSVDLCLSR